MIQTKEKKKTGKWVRLGEVGVDSGQLVVCDPCYIDSEWEQKDVEFASLLYDNKLKKYITSPNKMLDKGINWESKYKKGLTYNQALQSGRLTEERAKETHEFNYDGCCRATCQDDIQGGQLNYEKGHAGVGVAFASGLGDGCYEVWGLEKKCGEWGKRLVEVRIKLIPEELED